jgi:hypothetical protein
MNNFFKRDNKPSQSQEQLQIRLKGLDDVFHNTIIALERLEYYLENEKSRKKELQMTAVRTDRDLHDDKRNPPTLSSLHTEIHTQCLALFYQTNFDKDQETFKNVLQYFLEDIFTWYGGRVGTAADEIEKYFLPISAALSRQIKSAADISKIIRTYVIDLDDISKLSDEEKEEAVVEGFTALNKAHHITEERMKVFMDKMNKGEEFEFTSHSRGTLDDGIKRLLSAFTESYETKTPADTLLRFVSNNFPESQGAVIETLLNKLFNTKHEL